MTVHKTARKLGLEREITDPAVHQRTMERFAEAGVELPTFAQLAEPARIPERIRAALAAVDPDAAHPLNLFRVHWHNGADRRSVVPVPAYLEIPRALTGVEAPIFMALGNRFPMIGAHKVLAAYACLVPRILTGQFDPTAHRAVWPSTGNYCRGGVAISRLLGCRGVAVLPEGMSAERFHWLEEWAGGPQDIIRTVGTESNVKEIYDKCNELERDPRNVIFNQFCEFGNHLAHWFVTGRAMERIFADAQAQQPGLEMAAFVYANGSAGTLGAGDYLKEQHGARIVAVEALECPTMLYNGFGEHNIQGIGDKHIPLIHNVENTDVVTAVSDRATDELNVLFNTEAGREYLVADLGLAQEQVQGLVHLGLSSICNLLAAIKLAKALNLGRDQAILSIATDGAAMYRTEEAKALSKYFPAGFDRRAAARVFAERLQGAGTEDLLELGPHERDRIFNLGYYTWVEQQGVSLEDFEIRRDQRFWKGLRDFLPAWDRMIEAFNRETGVAVAS